MGKLNVGWIVGLSLIGIANFAQALTITPQSYDNSNLWVYNVNAWSGVKTGDNGPNGWPKEFEVKSGIVLDHDDFLYKATPPSTEEGSLASSYNTTFSGTTGDWYGALIEYTGGYAVDASKPIYLLVKDGQNDPSWYIFALAGIWDGVETITLDGFWKNVSGSISHVSIYGDPGTVVPEPATMLLFGTGLAGLAGLARRKKS